MKKLSSTLNKKTLIKIGVGLAIVLHFAVIVVSISDPIVDENHPFWVVTNWYGKITGASASYSFFSPNIPREVVFKFTIYNRDKTQFETTLQDTANNEVNARIGNILRMIPKNFESKKIVRSMAASVTASMFKLYPEAEKIQIQGSIFMLPTMENYAKGERTTLKPIYTATFSREPGV